MIENGIKTIEPKKTFSLSDIKEMWEYRELLYFLTLRDYKVRYKQTTIGILWVLLQPLFGVLVLSLIFSRFNESNTTAAYPIFVCAGLLLWLLFSGIILGIIESLQTDKAIISKVYFPRIIIPISASAIRVIDFFFGLLLLAFLILYYSFTPSIYGVMIYLFSALLTVILATGIGLLCACLTIKYKDVKYTIPFVIQIFFFATPIFYSTALLGTAQKYAYLNPLSPIIEFGRNYLLNESVSVNIYFFYIPLLLLTIGYIYFKKTERYIADIL